MKMKKLTSTALAAALAIGTFGFSVPAKATEVTTTDYVITIPASLTVGQAGWNETSGIKAEAKSGETFNTGKKLNITAASGNGEWALKADGVSDTVGYKLTAETEKAKNYSDAIATTSLDISAGYINNGTSIPFGVIVEDYSDKKPGEYTDTVTFTASVESAAWDGNLSTLTADVMATNGTIITGTLSANVKVSIADSAKLNQP